MSEASTAGFSDPFVGREVELAAIRPALDEVRQGSGRLFLLVGEPGIGKTRLADEIARSAVRDGFDVRWGRCWEGGGAPAFWPWRQIVRGLLESPRHDGPEDPKLDDAGEFSGLLAEYPAHPDGPMTPADAFAATADPAGRRFQLFEACSTFLRKRSLRRPLAVILDDLHAADLTSLLMLRFVARELRDSRILVVGTYRPLDAARDQGVAKALDETAREGRQLWLKGLSAADVGRCLAMLGGEAQARVVAEVHRVTDGNPLFVSELARLLSQRGAFDTPPDGPSQPLQIPDEIRVAVRQRLSPLGREARAVLEVAACVGREFDLAVLREVLTSDQRPSGATTGAQGKAPQLVVALDEARAAGLIRRNSEVTHRFTFSHVLVRDVLHDDLSAADRMALHRSIARAVESLHLADLGPHLAEIAHHYNIAAPAGDATPAVEYSQRAADHAMRSVAYEEAIALYQSALDSLVLVDNFEGADERRCELLLALGDAIWGSGDISRMRKAFLDAAALARLLPPPRRGTLLARAALGFGGRQQRAHLIYDEPAVQLIEEGLAALDPAEVALAARMKARLAYMLYSVPSLRKRRQELARAAAELARQTDDVFTRWWVLNDARWALWSPDTFEERAAISAELSVIVQQLDNREMAMAERVWRAVDCMERGDLVEAGEEIDAIEHLSREFERPFFRRYASRFSALRAMLEGRFAEAERLTEQWSAEAYRVPMEDAKLLYGIQILHLRAEQERVDELEARLKALMAEFPGVPIWRYSLNLVASRLENASVARLEFERVAARNFDDLPQDYLRLNALAYLAETCAFLEDTERAPLLYSMLEPYADRCVMIGYGVALLGSVHHYLGLLAPLCRSETETVRHFEDALAAHERILARPAAARTRFAYARFLLRSQAARSDSGSPARQQARAMLEHAAGTARELGMKRLEEKAREFLAESSPESANAAASSASADAVRRGVLRRDGGYWTVALDGTVIRVKDMRGLTYIAHLLRNPAHPVHVAELIGIAESKRAGDVSGAGPAGAPADPDDETRPLDAKAIAQYRARLAELRDDLEELVRNNDLGRAAAVRREIEALTEQVADAQGLDGRDRDAAAQTHRSRVAVAKAVRAALDKIGEHHPDLAGYLRATIKTGAFCSHQPAPFARIEWELDD